MTACQSNKRTRLLPVRTERPHGAQLQYEARNIHGFPIASGPKFELATSASGRIKSRKNRTKNGGETK
ncbi:unnamed protein product [Larinioides sclopetarius]|uniref:Uncharacterized protein n=1 Tax=Larinioides sclopetarius TaxID=280406 RepID=A0AAV1ZQZ2_9ARAC